MAYRPRLLILPAAAIIIFALCAFRMANPRGSADQSLAPTERRPAPAFELYDQESTLVNLDAYLHRHPIAVVFYDGSKGPEADPLLVQLRQFYPAIKRAGAIVLGVSTALPQENRNNSSQAFPFPLLTDAVALDANSVHRTWDRLIEPASANEAPRTQPGAFLIDRLGLVAWEDGHPRAEESRDMIMPRLLGE